MNCLLTMFTFYFRIKKFKADFLAKSPYQKWITIRKLNIFLLKVTGTHLMSPDWQKGKRLWIPVWLEANLLTLMIYTIFYYRYNLMNALSATTMLSLMVPVSCFKFTLSLCTE